MSQAQLAHGASEPMNVHKMLIRICHLFFVVLIHFLWKATVFFLVFNLFVIDLFVVVLAWKILDQNNDSIAGKELGQCGISMNATRTICNRLLVIS